MEKAIVSRKVAQEIEMLRWTSSSDQILHRAIEIRLTGAPLAADDSEVSKLDTALLARALYAGYVIEEETFAFNIPVTWSLGGVLSINARTLDEAVAIAKNSQEFPASEYIDGSFAIDIHHPAYGGYARTKK